MGVIERVEIGDGRDGHLWATLLPPLDDAAQVELAIKREKYFGLRVDRLHKEREGDQVDSRSSFELTKEKVSFAIATFAIVSLLGFVAVSLAAHPDLIPGTAVNSAFLTAVHRLLRKFDI
jgi:hypothetical protein